MMKIAVRNVINNFGKYGQMAHEGSRIIVTKNGRPWFVLVPHQTRERRVEPLEGVKPLIREAEATAPIDPGELPGWS
jgi:prevent-host-death family protein